MRINLSLAGSLLLGIASVGYWYTADSARLMPDRRVVEVHEVDNGYLILYKTANNPYPAKEAVAINAASAATGATDGANPLMQRRAARVSSPAITADPTGRSSPTREAYGNETTGFCSPAFCIAPTGDAARTSGLPCPAA